VQDRPSPTRRRCATFRSPSVRVSVGLTMTGTDHHFALRGAWKRFLDALPATSVASRRSAAKSSTGGSAPSLWISSEPPWITGSFGLTRFALAARRSRSGGTNIAAGHDFGVSRALARNE
jgi:hypothetical protein